MSLTFRLQQELDAPPERVFRALTCAADFARWIPGFVRCERLDDGPLRVGSRWRETRMVFRREATEEFEVTALEPPGHLGLCCDGSKGASGRGEYLFDYELEGMAGGTRLTLQGEVRGLGRMWLLFARVFAGSYRKAIARDLLALRTYLAGAHEPVRR